MTADVVQLPVKTERVPLGVVRFVCGCGSHAFNLWTDGQVHCANCDGYHYKIKFTVEEESPRG